METENFLTHSENETIELGKEFAEKLKPGDIVAFFGDLGAGKTEFIKGICDFFKVDEIVTSPTFTIMNQYSGTFEDEDIFLYHIDLYRIKNLTELDEIGFDECLHSKKSIKLIEWAEKADTRLDIINYTITMKIPDESDNLREIIISKVN